MIFSNLPKVLIFNKSINRGFIRTYAKALDKLANIIMYQ